MEPKKYLNYYDIAFFVVMILLIGVSVIFIIFKFSGYLSSITNLIITVLIFIRIYILNSEKSNQLQPINSTQYRKSWVKQLLDCINNLIKTSIQTSVLTLLLYFIIIMIAVKLDPSLSSGAGGVLGFIIVPGIIVFTLVYLAYELVTSVFKVILKKK